MQAVQCFRKSLIVSRQEAEVFSVISLEQALRSMRKAYYIQKFITGSS